MRVLHLLVAVAGLSVAACGTSVDPDGGMGMLDAARIDSATPSDAGTDAGPPGCIADGECDDGVDCTADTCTIATGTCRHQVVPALCPAGSSCHPMRGCEMGRPCATDMDCMDEDACTTGERCDPATRVCAVEPLDGDGDGDPPRVCGGGDCDDSDALVFAGAAERCNTVDDDCDGATDEGLEASACSFCRTVNACGDEDMHTCYMRVEAQLEVLACSNRSAVAGAIGACASSSCSAYRSCRDMAGAMCACGGGLTLCGGLFGTCADTSTDHANCGSCGNACSLETMCVGGSCVCPGGLALCGTRCIDTATDFGNCGACGRVCPSGSSCTGGTCLCPAGETACGTSCVDTSTDAGNCGACGRVCAAGSEVCHHGACVPCGVRGNPCCSGTCGAGLTCGYDVPDGSCISNDVCWFNPSACASGQSCFLSIAAGFAFCAVRTGSLPLGAACDDYTECASGLTCTSGICQQVCHPLSGGECPVGGTCSSSSTWGTCCGAYGELCCGGFGGGTCGGYGTCNAAGTCDCVPAASPCDGACVPTSSDPMNCGGCGRTCAASQNCVSGTCTACGTEGSACCFSGSSCASGLFCADGTCRRLAACDVFAQTGCLSGEACYADQYGAGTYCAPPGSGPRGSICTTDTSCAAGMGCTSVIRDRLCRPYCDTSDGVPGCLGGETCDSIRTGSIGICR